MGELVSEGDPNFRLNFQVGDDGRLSVAKDLAFGVYRVTLTLGGFSPPTQLVEIRTIGA